MPAFYKIDKEHRLVLSTASGTFSHADALAHMEGLLKDPDLGFGLARMFETFRENEGEMGIRVFRRLEEALEWVFSKSTNA